MQEFRFYKEPSNRWFIDLPGWTGGKDDLEMILGADTMLDIVSGNTREVRLQLSTEPFDGADYLKRIEPEEGQGGMWYFLRKLEGKDYAMARWLCDVTLFVFGNTFPDKIYIKRA